jgi:hypothetical protein
MMYSMEDSLEAVAPAHVRPGNDEKQNSNQHKKKIFRDRV